MKPHLQQEEKSTPSIQRGDLQVHRRASHHHRQFEVMGAHCTEKGTWFTVWAPTARNVGVIGSFNHWNSQPLQRVDDGSGRWSGFIAGVRSGDCYKFRIQNAWGHWMDKADPYAFRMEPAPGTASQVWDLSHHWTDQEWMQTRWQRQAHTAPISIYEVHLGSWQREEDGRFLNYRELANRLATHCHNMGFTHVELMPVTEHPFYGSWGYQTTGYYAPTSRYGTPQDLMAFVDTLHQQGIGVFLDWVPSHFPADPHALARFDGTALYEHEDPRRGFHPEWNSLIFNYGRYEVRDFLISNALFWLEKYHFDGLRVDAVASMLYLDYARRQGEWIPNQHGGRENHDAVRFLQDLNTTVYSHFPDVHMIAEESTAWPAVSRPVEWGGLGFGMKWNMGWMNDTLRYMSRPHFYRHWHNDDVRFSMVYAFHENFILPLSHDEVVYGKGSMIGKQPGDEWQRFAGLRNLYGYMWSHPGKKLLFMGCEFGQLDEWHHDRTLDWHLWARPYHAGLARWVADLNAAYRGLNALHCTDFDGHGFSWLPCERHETTVLTFLRRGRSEQDMAVVICNMTPEPRHALRVAMPEPGTWHEILNSDAAFYGGSGVGNMGRVHATAHPVGGWPASALVTVPPLGTVILSSRPLSNQEVPHARQ
ncbi:1,4-alpha-glucan branching protein GlgB [Ramlibacter monticola]|uniref:1,4-alpha-glucan branching enzyme GlgB n=1 Tax=Ramlibacter monticola TaxID=1926872 RepID=A0A936Z0I9_9BURK|nr:1,4-alpha-glucan branching protein GlgB [Ramlibacter monticola]MBL0391556.1 1,4-alpha-glucan branching protein GlgB [Ramlibacter monticola]